MCKGKDLDVVLNRLFIQLCLFLQLINMDPQWKNLQREQQKKIQSLLSYSFCQSKLFSKDQCENLAQILKINQLSEYASHTLFFSYSLLLTKVFRGKDIDYTENQRIK